MSRRTDNKIVAVFNPYRMELAVRFMDHDVFILEKFFDNYDDWIVINHPTNKDEYLHIHLDYDSEAQLMIYYRYDGDDGILDDCDSWKSSGHCDPNIFIVHTDLARDMAIDSVSRMEFYPKVRYLRMKK